MTSRKVSDANPQVKLSSTRVADTRARATTTPGARAAEGDAGADPDELARGAYEQVLEKSCCTNEFLDAILLKAPDDGRGAKRAAEAFWRQPVAASPAGAERRLMYLSGL